MLNYALEDYETGKPVRVPEGATHAQIRKAIEDAGQVPKGHKFFGMQGDEQESSEPKKTRTRITAIGDERIGKYADDLRSMAGDVGWAEEGGKLLRDANGNPNGRTRWIPHAEWFVAGMIGTPKAAKAAVEKAVAGEPMTAKEKRTVQAMMDWLDNVNSQQAEMEALDSMGYDEMSIAEQDVIDTLGDLDIDNPTAVLAASDTAQAMRSLGFTEEEIRAELKQTNTRQGNETDAERSQVEAQGSVQERAETGTGESGRQEAPQSEALELRGQTNAEASAEFKRQQEKANQQDKEPPAKNVTADQVNLFNTQGGLFNSNRDGQDGNSGLAMQESAVYAVNEPDAVTGDLFPEELQNAVSATNRKDRNGRKPAKAGDGDLRSATALSVRPDAKTNGVYHVSTQLVTVGKRKLPVKQVTSWNEAAQAFAYLSRYAVEHFDALVTDAQGKILAVIGSFKGTQTQASVYPGTVMMELSRINGAAHLWASHNHPSGLAELSSADRTLSRHFEQLLRDTSVTYHGLSAMAQNGDRVDWTNTGYDSGSVDRNQPAKHAVPIVEREIVESNPGEAIPSPSAAKSIVRQLAGARPGIVFLTAQNNIAAFVPFDPLAMGELRSGGRLMQLFGETSKAGASGAFVAMPDGKVTDAQFANLKGALGGIDVMVLDGIRYSSTDQSAPAESLAEKGLDQSKGLNFYSQARESESRPTLPVSKAAVREITSPESAEVAKLLGKELPKGGKAGIIADIGTLPSAAEATGSRMSRKTADAIRFIAQMFGRKVVFYEATHNVPEGINQDGKTLYVNVDSGVDALAVAGHEFTHSLEHTDPEAYQAALDSVKANFVVSQGKPGEYSIRESRDDPSVAYMAAPMLQPNEAQVYVKGKAIRVQLNDELLARAYKNLGAEQLGTLLGAAREVNTYLSKAYTGYNPEFFATNVIRDFTTGVINLTGEEGARFALKTIRNYPAAFKNLLIYAKTGRASSDITSYRANGGSTGAAYLSDLERIGADAIRAYQDAAGVKETYRTHGKKAAARVVFDKTIETLAHYIEVLNQAGENAMRLAAFNTALQNGLSMAQAASLAKNCTVNFNRKGELGSQLSALYLFANPNIQGTAALVKALTSSKHKWQARALTGGLMMLGYTMAQLLNASGDDKKIPENERDRNFVISIGDKIYKMPVPYGYGFFYALGTLAADIASGKITETAKMALRVASSFSENFSPFGNPWAGDKADAKNVVQLMPITPAKWVAQMAANRNSFGGVIYPDFGDRDHRPDSQKMNRTTKGGVSAWLAESTNELTGGNKVRPGWVDVSPESINFMTRNLVGGTGKFIGDSTMMMWNIAVNGVAPDIHEVPIVRKFVGEERINTSRARFYDAANEVKEAADELANARKLRDPELYKATFDENRELIAIGQTAQAFRKMATALRDQEDKVMADDSKTLSEKRLIVKGLEMKESDAYERFMKIYRTQKDKRRERAG